jgi:Ca2+-binding RTX toxin-like protein
MRTMPLRTVIPLTAAMAVLALPAAAHGAIAGPSQIEGSDIVFTAGPGEANRVTVTGQGTGQGQRVLFEDAGAPVQAGRTCDQLAPNRVSCPRSDFVIVRLEDGDDEAQTSGELVNTYVSLEGEQGSDSLRGIVGITSLDGGTGTDRLEGGSGSIRLSGVDLVRRGDFREVPDHNRERDEIVCAESFPGSNRPLPLRVEVDANDVVSGPCPPRYVFLEAFVVVEGTEGADSLASAGPPTRLNGLGGDDLLSGQGARDRLDGGAGNDRLFGQGLLLGGTGDDRLDGGSGSFLPSGVRADGQAGEDQILGTRAADSLTGGTGRDTISARGGNDSVRARDGSRDRVTCGGGRDRVSADRGDTVSRDCEVVSRG